MASNIHPIVISGPSGSGKSTLLERLFAKYPNLFGFSCSHTTRSPRPGEVPGKSYHFIERDEFERMIAEKKFIEHAEYAGNCYGTSFEAVEVVQSSGRICILDLEINGVRSIKNSPMHAKYIFVQPPSIEVLEQRLRSRNTETEETLQTRLATAKDAMDFAETGAYDKIIVNDDLDKAFAELDDFISVLTKPSLTTDAVAPTEAESTKPEPVDNAAVSSPEATVAPVAQKDTPSKKSKVCTII